MCPECYDEKKHAYHYIENVSEYYDLKKKKPIYLKDLQSEIERIEKVYNKLINVIVDWEQKLKEIKNNLESGINILKKLYLISIKILLINHIIIILFLYKARKMKIVYF